MSAWEVIEDSAVAKDMLRRLYGSTQDLTPLNERIVITLQAHTFRHWPSTPALGGLTLSTRPRGGSAVLQDSGRLRLSIVGKSPGSEIGTADGTLNVATRVGATIGSRLAYAAIHQYGGTIRARGKALSIPATPEARKARSPRRFPEKLHWMPSRGRIADKGLFVTYSGRGRARQARIQYLLASSVYIPARQYLLTQAEAEPIVVRVADHWLSERVA